MEPHSLLPDFFVYALPPTMALGASMAFLPYLAERTRMHTLTAMLGIVLAVALLGLLHGFGGSVQPVTQWAYGALAMLAALVVAVPMLDRARLPGAVAGSTCIAAGILAGIADAAHPLLPLIARGGWIQAALMSACIAGLGGSAWVRRHPSRSKLATRMLARGQWLMPLAGHVLLAGALGCLALVLEPATSPHAMVIAVIVAALATLLLAPRPFAMQRIGESLVAGTLLSLSVTQQPHALIAGGSAALAILVGPRLCRALRVDDPARLMGSILIPSLLGLVLPGIVQENDVHAVGIWAGTALACGIAGSVVLWPVVMATLGLRANSRLVREGMDSF